MFCALDYVFRVDSVLAVPMPMPHNTIEKLVRHPFKALGVLAASGLRLQEESELCRHIESHSINKLFIRNMVEIKMSQEVWSDKDRISFLWVQQPPPYSVYEGLTADVR